MKKIITLIFLIGAGMSLYAQKDLKGRVTDAATGDPLPGASILVAGKEAVTSDVNGFFAVPCSTNARITISFIGYETVQQLIRDCDASLVVALTPATGSLSNVEITATATQNKSILYQPSSITKVSTLELQRGVGLFLDDAINGNVPGVTMQRRAVSSGQQFNIRGYGNGINGTRGISSNFDIQGTKVYLNGIPVTDAEGITAMDDIDFSSIGNVEVVKGPAGTLYGLAIAGVVNLKTIRPEPGKTSIGQDVLAVNYGLRRYTTHLATASDHSSLLANYGYQTSDGFMVHNASTKRFVNLATDVKINNKQSVTAYFGYGNSYDERGGELTLQQFANKDYSGNKRYIQRNAHSSIISFRGGIGHTFQLKKSLGNTTTVFGSGVSSHSSSAAGWTDKTPLNFGLRSAFDSKFRIGANVTLSGITGVETQKQFAQTIGYNMVPDPNDANAYYIIESIKSNQATTTGTTSLFTEWSLSLPHEWYLTAGLGYSNMSIELNDRVYAADKRTHYDTSYKNMWSPHLAVNKVFNDKISVYASYSKGYKAPVSSIFFIPATGQLNTGLQPEIGNQFEVGTKGALLNNLLSYQFALFNTTVSNKMAAQAVAQAGTTLYSFVVNSGSQINKGIEALVKYTAYQSASAFVSIIRPFANFTYSHFRYDAYVFAGKDYSGKEVAGVPPITFNLGVDVSTLPGVYANAMYMYRDDVFLTAENDEAAKAKHFGLLNAKVGVHRSLSNYFDLDAFVGANNLTGTQYYNMVFVNQLPDAYVPAPLETVFFGGVKLNYNF
jgi:iron complex outermembrane receptor protein